MAKIATQELTVPDEVVMGQIYVIRGQNIKGGKQLSNHYA